MSAFEFISVSVAIVLALTLGRLMTAVTEVFTNHRRDFLHIGFYVLSYVGILTMWWAQWMMVNVEAWTFADFVLVMASPISQYFTVHILLSSNPSEITSWRSHLSQNHRWYFTAFLAQILSVTARRYLIGDETSILLFLTLALNAGAVIWAIISTSRLAQTVVLLGWAASLSFAVVVQFAIAH